MYDGVSLKLQLWRGFFFIGLLGLMTIGCTRNGTEDIPTPTLGKRLIPYMTATPSPTPEQGSAAETPISNPTAIPSPTSTPFVYEVIANDTLTGIAFRHSVTLEELMGANPGIDPNFLSIGMTLTIPIEGVVSVGLPTSTPISINIQPPVCYTLSDGGLQCMSVVENDQLYGVENVIVTIFLQPSNQDEPVAHNAITPLNKIPPGQKAAVSAYFGAPLPHEYTANANLLSVIPVSSDDQRYLESELQIQDVTISLDGQSAKVTGLIEILPEQPEASAVWVSGFAYDRENNIVGIRKWVADDVLISKDQIRFEIVIYSLGLSIDHVDILTEIRP